MAAQLNYYQLLNLEARRNAPILSNQEVKDAYRRALLQYHPDKKSHRLSEAKGQEGQKAITVDDIALAYKTLSEPDPRTAYDRWLQSGEGNGNHHTDTARLNHTGLETVDLDDLSFDGRSSVWSRGCRCGEEKGFTVSEPELEKNIDDRELIVGCKGCSLWLRVLFGMDE